MQELFLAMALGAVATYVTSALRSKWPKLGAREIQAVVFLVCLALAVVVTLVQKYAPAELLMTLSASFTTAIAYYEIALKKHEPKE